MSWKWFTVHGSQISFGGGGGGGGGGELVPATLLLPDSSKDDFLQLLTAAAPVVPPFVGEAFKVAFHRCRGRCLSCLASL